MPTLFADISRLVRPHRVAVVGASDRPGSLGYSTYNNVRNNSAIPGGCVPVNPMYESVLGDRSYPTVSAVPGEPIDVAIVLVPAGLAMAAVTDCAASGVRHVMLLSSGFSESDESGARLQNDIVRVAREAGMRIYGPNSPGLTNNADNILLTMSPVALDDVSVGTIGLVTQGGGLGRALMQWRDNGLGIGLWASVGNESDLDVGDFISHMVDDDRLQVIGAVVEGFSQGQKFIAAAKRAREAGKPIVVLKIGRSAYGQQSAASHTASIAGNDAVTDGVFRQYGVIRVEDVDELGEVLLLLSKTVPSARTGIGDVCVYSFSGGAASLGADQVGAVGLRLAEFEPATVAALKQRAPSFGFIDNPVDLTTKVFTDPGLNRAVFEVICQDANVGAILLAVPADYGESTVTVARDAVEIARAHDKLLIPVWMSPKRGAGYQVFADAGFAPFDGLRRATTALTRVVEWTRRDALPAAGSDDELRSHQPESTGKVLAYADARALLEGGGIRFPGESFVTRADEATAAAQRIGRPVAVKLAAEGLLHKTEVGGVALGVAPDDVARVFTAITDPARLAPFGFVAAGAYIQEMVPAGLDVLLGAHIDPVFGGVITVGTGGIDTEIEMDVLHLAVPFTDQELLEALRPLRLWTRLHGVRGGPAADVTMLVRVVQAFAALFASGSGPITEVEINPLRVVVDERGTDCVALDAAVLTG